MKKSYEIGYGQFASSSFKKHYAIMIDGEMHKKETGWGGKAIVLFKTKEAAEKKAKELVA